MNQFKKHKVDGKTLKLFKNDSSILRQFKSEIQDNNDNVVVSYALWISVCNAIKTLQLT